MPVYTVMLIRVIFLAIKLLLIKYIIFLDFVTKFSFLGTQNEFTILNLSLITMVLC